MESEFLLVWVPTARLHLAVPGVTLSSVDREIQGRAGAGHRDRDPSSVRGHRGEDSAETLPLLYVWP